MKGELQVEVNQEKRQKFIENAGKRVNNVIHAIEILEPMSRSNVYDFTKNDVEEMFSAMQETLNNAKEEYYKKFEEKSRAQKKVFSFGQSVSNVEEPVVNVNEIADESENVVENNVDMSSSDEVSQF